MSDPGTNNFAALVHEMLVLAEQGASRKSIRARVDSMHLELDEHAALLALAESMRDGSRPRRRVRARGRARTLTHA